MRIAGRSTIREQGLRCEIMAKLAELYDNPDRRWPPAAIFRSIAKSLQLHLAFWVRPRDQVSQIAVEAAPPMRKIRWNDNHIALENFATHSALNARTPDVSTVLVGIDQGTSRHRVPEPSRI